MKYRGFYVEITADKNIIREDKDSGKKLCNGFLCQVFPNESMAKEIDNFYAASGFELANNSLEEVQLFVREMIDCELKEYQKRKDEFNE